VPNQTGRVVTGECSRELHPFSFYERIHFFRSRFIHARW